MWQLQPCRQGPMQQTPGVLQACSWQSACACCVQPHHYNSHPAANPSSVKHASHLEVRHACSWQSACACCGTATQHPSHNLLPTRQDYIHKSHTWGAGTLVAGSLHVPAAVQPHSRAQGGQEGDQDADDDAGDDDVRVGLGRVQAVHGADGGPLQREGRAAHAILHPRAESDIAGVSGVGLSGVVAGFDWPVDAWKGTWSVCKTRKVPLGDLCSMKGMRQSKVVPQAESNGLVSNMWCGAAWACCGAVLALFMAALTGQETTAVASIQAQAQAQAQGRHFSDLVVVVVAVEQDRLQQRQPG